MRQIPRALRHAELAGGVSLVTSAGTLVCCTIPALLVAMGAGAALASAVSAFPALVWLSQYKGAVFGSAGAMLIIAGVMQWRVRSAPCPADPVVTNACLRARLISRRVYAISVLTFGVGAFFAFVLPALL